MTTLGAVPVYLISAQSVLVRAPHDLVTDVGQKLTVPIPPTPRGVNHGRPFGGVSS